MIVRRSSPGFRAIALKVKAQRQLSESKSANLHRKRGGVGRYPAGELDQTIFHFHTQVPSWTLTTAVSYSCPGALLPPRRIVGGLNPLQPGSMHSRRKA